MKKLISLLIAFNLTLPIAYSQNVEKSHLKEINGYLIERNECVDLLAVKEGKLYLCDSLIQEYDSLYKIKQDQLNTCDTLYFELYNENKQLTTKLDKKVKVNKNLTKLVLGSFVVICLLLVI